MREEKEIMAEGSHQLTMYLYYYLIFFQLIGHATIPRFIFLRSHAPKIMLAITRKLGEKIIVDDSVVITVKEIFLDTKGTKTIKLGIRREAALILGGHESSDTPEKEVLLTKNQPVNLLCKKESGEALAKVIIILSKSRASSAKLGFIADESIRILRSELAMNGSDNPSSK